MFMTHITAMNPRAQAVLVTGTAKGIGNAVVERLIERGYHVYAGVRQEADAERWRGFSERVHPLIMDVTDQATIDAAARAIQSSLGSKMLAGVVNNAGIAIAGPLEFLPIAELRRQLEVNVIGQIAVTQAVLPMLRVSRGRIINIGSIAGRSALPLTGAYAASKFALEALTDSLRVELMPSGIEVCIIEPGVIATPIWDTSMKDADRILKDLPKAAFDYYGRIIAAVRKRAERGTGGLPPSVVADAVEHALTPKRPRSRYLIGRDAKTRALFQRLPDRVRDRLIARQLAKL